MKKKYNFYMQFLSFTLVVNAKINNVLYDIIIKKIKKKSHKIIKYYFKTNSEYCLQIGCGNNVLSNWLNSDIDPMNDEILFLDASEKFPFDNDVFQFVFSEHLIEHLHFEGVINLLKESYRTLKIGGVLRIATPDLDFLHKIYQSPHEINNQNYVKWALNSFLKNISNSQFSNTEINHIYVINNFHKDWGHQIIFTYETLEFLLKVIGFRNVSRKEIGKSKYNKLTGVERHSKSIPNQFNEMETMVIEALK